MTSALVAIAKMEHNYIEEWVRYNLHIGFDSIYIYENDDEPKYAEMLKEFPQVTVIRYPGAGSPTRSIQYHMLNDFCRDYKDKHKWIAHFDLDEFLVLKKHKTIREFCEDYLGNDEGGIGFCWVHFGDNGHANYSPEPVTSRFTKREDLSKIEWTHVKCLVCVSCLEKYVDFHIPDLKQGAIRTTSGTVLKTRETRDLSIDVAQLNHYLCKSMEEFQRRKIRGQAGLPSTHPNRFGKGQGGRYSTSFFHHFNRNHLDDFLAKEIYEECLRKTTIPE